MSTNDFTLDGLGEQAVGLWDAAKAIWLSGGWAMFAIAVIALVMFSIGLHLHLFLGRKKFLSISERKWRHWIAHPVERRGPIGDFLNMATGPRSLPEMGALLGQLRASETAPIERDLRMMRVCVGAAPLVGLLGDRDRDADDLRCPCDGSWRAEDHGHDRGRNFRGTHHDGDRSSHRPAGSLFSIPIDAQARALQGIPRTRGVCLYAKTISPTSPPRRPLEEPRERPETYGTNKRFEF